MILILHEEIEQARYGLLLTRGLAVMFLMAVMVLALMFMLMVFTVMTVVMFLVTAFLVMFGRLLSAVGMRRFTVPIPRTGAIKGRVHAPDPVHRLLLKGISGHTIYHLSAYC